VVSGVVEVAEPGSAVHEEPVSEDSEDEDVSPTLEPSPVSEVDVEVSEVGPGPRLGMRRIRSHP
jgi:hypothetical protein